MAVKEQLIETGMKNISGDGAFFYFRDKNGDLAGLSVLHVDFLISGNQELHEIIVDKLKGKFQY